MAANLQPGTVLVTRSKGWGSWLIRFGAALSDKPNLGNHVAVVHHVDAEGTTWCIEGRPGGVGWKDAKGYLASKWTITNTAQPFTKAQGGEIAKAMEALLGTPYDWQSIVGDALASLGMTLPGWDTRWEDGQVAGQVVCSSAAAYAYGKANVKHPTGNRGCVPADWVQWILTKAWQG